jgi:hypothetical protein
MAEVDEAQSNREANPEYDAGKDTYYADVQQDNEEVSLRALEDAARARLAERASAAEAPTAQPANPTTGFQRARTPEEERTRTVVREAAEGVVEAPIQAVGGAADAISNMSAGLADLAQEMDGFIDLSFDLPSSGNKAVDMIATAIGRPLDTLSKTGDLISPADTFIGAGTREISKFLTGFLPALRATKAAGLTGATGAVVAGGATGFAVFDPQDPNLANIIADQPIPDVLKKPFELLSTNPNDPQLINRAKNMIVESGVGLGAEAVVKGIQTAIKARNAMKANPDEFLPATISDEMYAPLGNFDDPLVSPRQPKTVKKKGAAEKLSEADEAIRKEAEIRRSGLQVVDLNNKEQVFINFGRISAPEDVKATMQGMADAFKGTIKEAQRGRIAQSQTKKLADDLGMDVEELLERQPGQAFNAEQVFAARELYTASGKKVEELAKRAASANAGEIDQFMLRKQLATHYAIQSEVLGVRAEAARALGAWRITSTGEQGARAISEIIERHGGAGVTKELAIRIASASAKGNLSPQALTMMARRGWMATTRDAVKEVYVLGMLWKPTTHLVNILSNSSMIGINIAERGIAAQISRITPGQGVQPGEAVSMLGAIPNAIGEGLEYGWKALKTGETGRVMSKTELREATITSERIAVEAKMKPAQAARFQESAVGRGIDLLGNINRLPGNALAAEDEFFKTVTYRAEVSALANREARLRGLQGEEATNFIAKTLQEPPAQMRLEAADAALYNTFQNTPGWFIRGLMMARDSGSMNPSFLTVPFLRTLGNISAATFERTPAAPLVRRWREDIVAGGARRDVAIARTAMGTMVMSTINEMANSGIITGAGPRNRADREALERTKWQAFSVRVGDTFVQYDRLDPMGSVLAFGALVNDAFNETELDEEDLTLWEQNMMPIGITMGEMLMNRTWAQGLTNTIGAIRAAQSGGSATQVVTSISRNFVPAASAFDFMREFTDPVSREPLDPFDAMKARLPIFSQNVLKRRDLWGQAIEPQEIWGSTFDLLSPSRVTRLVDSPIDEQMVRLEAGIERIRPNGSFDGVRINFREFPEAYDEYRILAGNEFKDPARFNLGARDFLNSVVTGNSPFSPVWNIQTDADRSAFISSTISSYRVKSAKAMMESGQHPELRALVNKRKQLKFEEGLPRDTEAPQIFGDQ